MNIALIENGMELSQVREILNQTIQKVNGVQATPLSFNDLADRPCINGVELTTGTTAAQLNLTLSQLSNTHEIENLVVQIGEQRAAETARNELGTKLDADFTTLPAIKYNFNDKMLITIGDGKEIYQAKIHDLLLYLKYLILQDATFEKFVPAKETASAESAEVGDDELADDEPGEVKPIDIKP